jgi:large subunit ribosomal protein L29
MKIKEVKELSTKEIEERIEAEKISLDQKKINHSISPLDNPSQIKEQRKTIARLLTELHQRKQNNN